MTTLTRGLGAVLIVVGVVAYMLTGASSPTALIRAVLGLVILVLGVVASRPTLHRHAIHGALLVAVLLVVGSAGNATAFMRVLFSGEQVESLGAGVAYTITLLLCAAYFVVGILAFVAENRAGGRRIGGPNHD